MDQTLERCRTLIAAGEFAQHVAINAAKVVALQDDPRLHDIVRRCELVTADGQSIVWASRALGDPLPSRVAGIDLMNNLFELAEREGYRIFILGARQDVLERAVQRLHARHPALTIAGSRHGYYPEAEDAQVAEEIRQARPDILFVAMTSPRKEYWLGRYGRTIDVPLVMGVGGAIDVLAGVTRRAPELLQRYGLEWAYRLAQEPRRLIRRYAVTNTRFLLLIAREAASRASRRAEGVG